MNKKVSLVLVVLILSFGLFSPAGSSELEKPSSAPRHFLWKAVSSEKTVYLFGSIHFGKPDMYPLPTVIENAFRSSDALVLEVNLERLDPQRAQEAMMQKGSYRNGSNLRENVSAEVFDRLSARLFQFGLTFEQVMHFKPWLMAMTLSVLQLQVLGFDSNYGIDHYFAQNAIRGNKEILEFESLEKQLDFMDSIKDQEKFLDYTLVSLDETEKMFGKIIVAWQKGDANVMQKIVITDLLEKYPDVESTLEILLYSRNRDMAAQIQGFESRKTYFVVVGAAHLIGEKGIVELLRDEGFKIQQL